jgi:antitoxin component YwqK of YwqJK toxin-antitoxin module
MKKTRIRNVSLSSLLIILSLIYSCSRTNNKEEVVTIVDKKNNSIEKGLLRNGKKEGYWVYFDTNFVIQYDIQYKNDVPNGKTTNYYDGAISIEAELLDGERNGKYTSYHKYPIIATQGNVKMGKSIGEWRTYAKDGRLNTIIQFEKDTFKIILDNNIQDLGEE